MTKLKKNPIFIKRTISDKILLVRTTWHLDNRWNVFEAAICNHPMFLDGEAPCQNSFKWQEYIAIFGNPIHDYVVPFLVECLPFQLPKWSFPSHSVITLLVCNVCEQVWQRTTVSSTLECILQCISNCMIGSKVAAFLIDGCLLSPISGVAWGRICDSRWVYGKVGEVLILHCLD